MKILKFNESYQGNKIIKRFNNSILNKYLTDIEELKNKIKFEKIEILKLIREFINLDKEYFANKYGLYPNNVNDFKFYINENKPTLELLHTTYHGYKLIYKDANNLLDFLENPDLYRNTKKYNI